MLVTPSMEHCSDCVSPGIARWGIFPSARPVSPAEVVTMAMSMQERNERYHLEIWRFLSKCYLHIMIYDVGLSQGGRTYIDIWFALPRQVYSLIFTE